jgi:hypothetical protein
MHTLNLFEPQADGVDPRGWTAHERVGYELGRDYARHQVDLPEPYARADSPLRQGLLSGARDFGPRRLAATRPVQRWLQLRLHAWLRGRSVELIQVTPNYLQQIDVSHCPITREPLSSDARMGTDACVDRVRNDAGYAAGNLAVISRRANHAKGSCGHAQSMDIVTRLRTRATAQHAGLSAVQWARVAVLASFVEPLTHAQACAVPMLVLPPNRLRLFNPAQALQAFVSLQLLRPGWSQRLARFEAMLPDAAAQSDFKRFFMALLPRVIESGRWADPQRARWAVEDAWRAPRVASCWARFAGALTAEQCQALLTRAAARGLSTRIVVPHAATAATDGWDLATRGYVPYGLGPRHWQREPARLPG